MYVLMYANISICNFAMREVKALITDKETDESWDILIIRKINSGLVWAAGQYCGKKMGQIMSNFLWFHG